MPLFSEDIVRSIPEILCRNLINLYRWFLRTKNPSSRRAKTGECKWDSFVITKIPRSIATQHSCCLDFLAFVKPSFFELFITNSTISLTLGRAVLHIFFINWFGGKVTLSGGASRSISIEKPSFASFANFRIILHRSHLNGGSGVGRSKNGSIARRARSFGADCVMWYLIL